MKLTYLFPGQGSQAVGMGAFVQERFSSARAIFKEASEVLGFDLSKAVQEGPEDKLRQTDLAQPALYVCSYSTYSGLKELGLKPQAVAGHSVGEYAALAVAGVFTFREGLSLIQTRARLMQQAGQKHPGTMAAILGMEAEALETVCRQAQTKGVCVPVNYNSPEQIVIAGDVAAIEEAGRLATAAGAKRVIPLSVSGAFHSPLMAEAAAEMRDTLDKVTFQNPLIPVAMNADGSLHSDAASVLEQLKRQLDHPVRWVMCLQSLFHTGATHWIEVGSGRVLAGLVKKVDRKAPVFATDSAASFEELEKNIDILRGGVPS